MASRAGGSVAGAEGLTVVDQAPHPGSAEGEEHRTTTAAQRGLGGLAHEAGMRICVLGRGR